MINLAKVHDKSEQRLEARCDANKGIPLREDDINNNVGGLWKVPEQLTKRLIERVVRFLSGVLKDLCPPERELFSPAIV